MIQDPRNNKSSAKETCQKKNRIRKRTDIKSGI